MEIRRLIQLSKGLKTAYRGVDANARVTRFDGWLDRSSRDGGAATGYDHSETVKEYYDLCSELMVFGWGESLHFAPLSPSEGLEESKTRHQRQMIAKLELREGMTVIDVGCGIGGPMRRVAVEGGVQVLGVNTSEVQLNRAKLLDAEAGLGHKVSYLSCDFMDMSAIAGDTFDRGYAIESTCHAPDKVAAFAEIYRVLKPGALFWGQEMCMTDHFDPGDNRHRAIRQDLMRGIALKNIASMPEVNRSLEAVGFQVIEGMDMAFGETGSAIPWYRPMETRHGTLGSSLYRVPLGRKLLPGAFLLGEIVGVFPKGSASVIRLLDRTANAYVAGGKAGIFMPLYCFLARKPG